MMNLNFPFFWREVFQFLSIQTGPAREHFCSCLLHPKWRFWKCIPLISHWFGSDQRGWAAPLFVPFCAFLYRFSLSWRADKCMVPPLSGRVLLLKHFQHMPFLIKKNKENAPGLVQLYVPLSAASVLWFLLPLSFTCSLAVITLVLSAFPRVALGRPPCPALLLWLVQPRPCTLTLLCNCSSRLGSSKPVSSVVLSQQRLPVEAAPVVG